MPEISVVVPVYKVEDYLHRCVDSILGQTYADFELILVDDGSPDTCGAICDEYAARDSRIRVIHQENGGLSAARNSGIDWVFANSDSRWFTFIDSDDWVHPQLLESLLSAAKKHNTQISVCGFAETAGENPGVSPEELVSSRWEAEPFYREKFINATVAWGKLYSRSCIGENRYPVGKLHEDEFLTYRLLFTQGEIAYVPAALYAYYVNPEGITRKKWNPRRLDAWEAYEQQIAFFEERNDKTMVRHRYRGYLENAMVNLRYAEQDNTSGQYEQVLRFMHKRIRSILRRAWKQKEIAFWGDFDILYRFYPMLTRFYRLYLEIKSKLIRK